MSQYAVSMCAYCVTETLCVISLYRKILQRTLGWRTCLIVPELEHEIRTHKGNAKLKVYINDLRALQYDLDEWADDLRYKVINKFMYL